MGTAALARQTAELQRVATASGGSSLFLATDQEGGQVQVLTGPGFSTIPRRPCRAPGPPAVCRPRPPAGATSYAQAGSPWTSPLSRTSYHQRDFSSGVTDSQTTPTDPNLAPFTDGVAAGASWLMVSTADYPAIDPHGPAVFSPTVMNLARERVGPAGLIVSDDPGHATQVASTPCRSWS